ncbi:hypothetical protein Tco_0271912 [Tanacetum coccineum]
MASLDHRLNPLFSIKECMSCGALYTADFCCSKGGLEDKILVPKPPQNCATCGNPVDGLNCRSCAFVRKCLNEGWYTIHDENEILNTSESSNHNTNVIPICYDDDEDYTIAITPVLSTKEPVDSLIMGDVHLDTIPSIENLVPIPRLRSYEELEYVEASPLNLEYDRLEEVNEDQEEKYRLVTNIESLKDNPTPDYVFKSPSSFPIPVVDSDLYFEEFDTSLSYLDNSLPEFETFSNHTEETRSGSTTTHANNSLPLVRTRSF